MDRSPKSVLLLTGMHRSNTSFLAKSFQQAGLHIGDRLIPADAYNIQGHFEDEDFIEFHQHLISKYRLKSRYSIIDYKRCNHLKLDQTDLLKAQQLVDLRERAHHNFGWKDPRSCHFLNHWKALIPHLKCVFIIRDPHAAVDSIVKRHTERSKISYRPDLWYRYHRFWQVCNQQILDYYQEHTDESILIFTPEDIIDPKAEETLNNIIIDSWKIGIEKIELSKNYNKDLITAQPSARPSRINTKSQELYQKLMELRSLK